MKIWAIPSGRAATTSWLSRFASSCQHRIAIARSRRRMHVLAGYRSRTHVITGWFVVTALVLNEHATAPYFINRWVDALGAMLTLIYLFRLIWRGSIEGRTFSTPPVSK